MKQDNPILKYLTAQLPQIDMIEFYSWSEGRTIKTHPHETLYQIDHYIKGEGEYLIGNQNITITTDKFFIIPPFLRHGIKSSIEMPLQGFHVKFSLPGFHGNFLPHVVSLNSQDCSKIHRLFRDAVSEAVLDQNSKSAIAALRLAEIIVLLVKLEINHSDFQKRNSIIDKAIEFMEKKYSTAISLDDVADEVGVTAAYLCRLFKKNTNSTPNQILRNIRCEYVKKEMESSNKKISEIAQQSGFKSPQYLSQVFHSVIGTSPLKYRKKKSENDLEGA